MLSDVWAALLSQVRVTCAFVRFVVVVSPPRTPTLPMSDTRAAASRKKGAGLCFVYPACLAHPSAALLLLGRRRRGTRPASTRRRRPSDQDARRSRVSGIMTRRRRRHPLPWRWRRFALCSATADDVDARVLVRDSGRGRGGVQTYTTVRHALANASSAREKKTGASVSSAKRSAIAVPEVGASSARERKERKKGLASPRRARWFVSFASWKSRRRHKDRI